MSNKTIQLLLLLLGVSTFPSNLILKGSNPCFVLPDTVAITTRKPYLPYSVTRVVTQTIPLFIASGTSVVIADDLIRTTRKNVIPTFRYRYDDYLLFAPLAMGLIGLWVTDPSKLPVSKVDAVGGYALSSAIALALVSSTKYTVKRMRPDGSTRNSFPSGHTATAFLGAELADIYFGESSPWLPPLTYSIAYFTGISRILNNRHWTSDVFSGAAFGIISANLGSYLSHCWATKQWKAPKEANVIPASEGVSLSLGQGLHVPFYNLATALPYFDVAMGFRSTFISSQEPIYSEVGVGSLLVPVKAVTTKAFISPYVHASLWFHLSHRGEVGVQVSAGVRKALGQKAFASGVRLSAFHQLFVRNYRSYRFFVALGNLSSPMIENRFTSTPSFEVGCQLTLFPF